jgi:hypothetical protein
MEVFKTVRFGRSDSVLSCGVSEGFGNSSSPQPKQLAFSDFLLLVNGKIHDLKENQLHANMQDVS